MKKIDTQYYTSSEGQTSKRILVDSYLKMIVHFFSDKEYNHIIQMGYGCGAIVQHIKNKGVHITVLEGDALLCKHATRIHDKDTNVEIIHTRFEEYNIENNTADLILANHILEHVDDSIDIVRKTAEWIHDEGTIFFTVPNANSLHRRIGVEMGLLGSVYDLNEQDMKVGHQRVYDTVHFLSDIQAGGYSVREHGGFNLKLVSQKQMREWSNELLEAIYRVSLDCDPEICSNLYALCQKNK